MLQSNRPQKFVTPFAQGDTGRTEIPVTSSDSTRASQVLGFPPLTGTPPEAGGVPPQREDMNGVLNQVARLPWWGALGGRFPFDAAFAADSQINGYPLNAVLPATLSQGEWYSAADNNTADPEGTGADWVPGYHYGATALAAQTGGNVTLTPNQAAKRLITVSGTLTSNLVITVPAWLYAWDFINNTGGAFTVSVKYPASGAVVIPQTGTPVRVLGDGSAVQVATQLVPAATNVTAGIQRNATNAEAAAGSLTTASITPASLASAALLKADNLASLANPATARSNLGLGAVATLAEVQISNVTGLTTALGGKVANGGGIQDVATTYGAWEFRTGNVKGRIQNAYYGIEDYFSISSNYRRTGAPLADGPLDLATHGTAEVLVLARNGAPGEVLLSAGPVGVAPTLRARAHVGGFAVTGVCTATGGFQDGSSRTIKHHIDNLTPDEGLAAVLALQGVRYCYHWGHEARLGYYAEDTQPVIPEAISEGEQGGSSPLLIEDTQMLPHHTGAIQALHRMITDLQARVAELERN